MAIRIGPQSPAGDKKPIYAMCANSMSVPNHMRAWSNLGNDKPFHASTTIASFPPEPNCYLVGHL